MARDLKVSIYSLSVSAVLMTLVPANASTVILSNPTARLGGPIAQSFLDTHGDNVSLLSTRKGLSCVASQPLRIAESLYRAPDGAMIPSSDVTRSPASSIQAVARPDSPVTFRIQLKYSPDPAKPVIMQIGDQIFSLVTTLEPSSDSLWLTGNTARILAAALSSGNSPIVQATSAATGRQITDQITSPDMAGLNACLVTLEELLDSQAAKEVEMSHPDIPDVDGRDSYDPEGDGLNRIGTKGGLTLALAETGPSQPAWPVPVSGLRVEFVARPDPETRVAASALAGCRMRNIPEHLFLGRLKAVTGFFSQTQDVYVAFDEEGQLQRAYIPGIFDSDLTMNGNSARVSLAADSNLPDQPNKVSGCLGDALLEAPICVFSNAEDNSYTLAECGVLGMSEERVEFLDPFMEPAFSDTDVFKPVLISNIGHTNVRPDVIKFGDNVFDTFSGRDDRSTPEGGGDGDIGGGGNITPIPLPGAIWLLLGALSVLSGLGGSWRGKVDV